MAGVKFSAFTTGATTANTLIVGYDSVAGTNNQYTLAQLAAGLPVSTLYGADGTIGTTRKALITDTIQFRDSGDTSDILSLNTNGIFTLGLGAVSSSEDNVVIGKDATDREAANAGNVIIGKGANLAATAGAEQYNVLIGRNATLDGNYNTCVGDSLVNTGGFNIAIGSGVNLVSNYSMGFGRSAKSTADNSITFNALSNQINTTNTVDNSFKVFMSSQTTPDLDVVGGGTSTLNTNFKITGQGYTELHDTTNTTLTVDWNNSNIQELTSLTGSLTFTASNPKAGATYILTLAQTGTVTATWTGVKWPAATAPTLSGAGKTDVITLICYDATGAGLYYGSSTLNFTT